MVKSTYPKKNSIAEKEKDRVDAGKIKKNDLMAFTYWGTIENAGIQGWEATVQVKNIEDGTSFNVFGTDLIKKSFSADQYHTERAVTKTELAETLTRCYNVPLTVTFIKADGSERKLRGRLVKTEPLMGRSYVEDLDLTDLNKTRLVDHRTLLSLIVGGVKYSLKEK